MRRRALPAIAALALIAAMLGGAQAEDNKALCSRFYQEAINGGNLELIDELVAEDFVDHEEAPGLEPNREGLKKFFAMMRTAFPDLKIDVEFMLADGDKVAAYLTMSGTHSGEFMGMPPSGKKFSIPTVDIVRFADGKAAEHWGVTDVLTMMQQLGVGPSMFGAPAPADSK